MDAASYLTEQEIVQLHERIIERSAGKHGVHNPAALESCVAQPKTAVFGVERFPTIFDKAAAYCFFIVRLHPFFDGNKRTGLAAALTYLCDRGIEPAFGEDEMYNAIHAVASGEADIGDLAAIFRRSVSSPGVNSA